MKKNSLMFNLMKTVLFFICLQTLLFAESPDYPGNCSNPTTASTFNFTTATSTLSKPGNVTYSGSWWWGYTEDNDFFLVTTPKAGTLTITISGSNAFFTTANNSCPTRNSTSRTTYTIHLDSATTNFNIGVFTNLGYSPNYTLSVTFTPDIITPSFSIADTTLNEGNVGIYTKNIPVTLSDTNGNTVTVNYATSNGTAITGSDYNVTSGTLTFSGSTTTQNIPVKINGDTTNENDEYFYITLSNATGGATIKDNRATITLLNDDGGATHAGERDFLIRNPISTQNIKGNIKVIGNTVLCYKQNGQCVDTNSANNQVSLSFIDTSSTVHTYNNSSQAQISSVPSTAKVLWAGLYTQGYMGKNYNDTTSALMGTPVYLITPSGTSIATTPNVIDVYEYTDNHYTYSTFSEVPTLKGMTGSQINGYFTGANIKAREGDDDGTLGYFAAWSLVVIYQDDSESLKNISVFDGYKRVSNDTGYQNVDITVDGFLTPTSGNVNSALSVFVGEGDKNIAGDSIFLNNIQIPDEDNDNAFNSTVNGFTPNPNPVNFQGIDIHNYDVGIDGNTSHAQIIGNSETSATIRLHTEKYTDNSADTYFPSMVAFTTELYEPRVCYVEAYYTEDGNTTLTSANVGDIITIKTWIANMKKDASDGNLETAEKVEITMEHDDTNLAYQSESTKIQNVGESAYTSKTDASDSDIATFTSDTNTSLWHIGTGANATNGGDLTPNVTNDAANKAYISFKEKIQTSGDITIANIYKVSYENSSMGLRIGDESPVNIGVCKDFNSSIAVSAPLGVFNVVNQNFSGSSDPKDTTDSLNALYTQVVGQNFTVKLLALNSDYITLKSYTGDVNLSLISKPNYLITDTDDQKQAKCDAASSLNTAQTITFANESLKTLTLNYSTAYQDVAFKIAYSDNNTRKYVCSRDSFAIRPATYSLAASSTNLIGGKTYTLTANALTNTSAVATGYNQSITTSSTDKNATIDLIIPTGCTLDKNSTNMALSFTSGVATNTSFTYNEIGDVNVTVADNNWTAIDQNSNSDCLVGSTTSTPDGNGKVGCLIQKTAPFTFSPKQFNNELTLQNFNDGNFTYISNDNTMSAEALLTTTAVLNDATTTAKNYTAKCYARDIDYTIKLINNKTLSNSTTQNRIRYFEDGTTSNLENNATLSQATFSSSEGNFTNGLSNLKMLFNFTRDSTKADEPFKIARNDFNITSVVDSNGTTGTDFNRTNDHNTTFYYGRAFAPDYTFVKNPGTASIYYEVYCKDCNTTKRSSYGLDGNESVKAINWYQNTNHTSTMGTINPIPTQTSKFSSPYDANTTTNPATQVLTATSVPLTDKINLNSVTWLQYYPTYYTVTFTGSGDWAGAGTVKNSSSDTNVTGATIDATVKSGARIQKRLDW
ncbi:hypothetical protein SJPD1_1148 [Sulfurospirillum diekertiae]|uniref:Calx-beta domain-containing protein n=1 Tax=Sulfurospirillum diekertiae TaxID=1854492 RepID=A0A290HUC8_9BACT|nr:Calx-beta domain-containing protein [Sulfurospirillum diekertiae]ATB69260.1 hypothetical protein SJPD1_1148 [Sulfurospirillum diekertiae]